MTETPVTSTASNTVPPAPEEPKAEGPLVGELSDSIAPMPTRTTVWLRTFVAYQGYRLAVVSLTMLKMIRRSHTH
jgi:hypothetical protein